MYVYIYGGETAWWIQKSDKQNYCPTSETKTTSLSTNSCCEQKALLAWSGLCTHYIGHTHGSKEFVLARHFTAKHYAAWRGHGQEWTHLKLLWRFWFCMAKDQWHGETQGIPSWTSFGGIAPLKWNNSMSLMLDEPLSPWNHSICCGSVQTCWVHVWLEIPTCKRRLAPPDLPPR